MLPYTLCFIRRGPEVLLLHRKYNPNANRWNGVGGKLEPGEAADEACLREIWEETGLTANTLLYRGVLTWSGSGIYLFTTDDFSGELQPCDEGTLEWKQITWVFEADDVTVTLPYILDTVLGSGEAQEYTFAFDEDGNVSSCRTLPLSAGYLEEQVCALPVKHSFR